MLLVAKGEVGYESHELEVERYCGCVVVVGLLRRWSGKGRERELTRNSRA